MNQKPRWYAWGTEFGNVRQKKIFLPFYPLKNPKNQNFERQNFLSFWVIFSLSPAWQPRKSKLWKFEKNNWRYFYLTHTQHKWQSYVQLLRYGPRPTEFFVILDRFLPFYPSPPPPTHPPPIPFLTAQKIKMLKKMKKKPGDIIVLPKCTKNHDHMLHCSSDTARDGCNFYFSFCTIFAFLPPLTTQKIKIF